MKCLLVGNYGTGNLGDEALKDYFLLNFPDAEWTVLSAHPSGSSEVPRLPFGLRSLLMTPWWRTVRALRSSDAVVFGGGSLFTDAESVFACLLWWWHAFVARIFRKPVILAFQGIGPFRTRVGEWCAGNVLRHAAFISVRDQKSADRVGVGVGISAMLSADPVMSFFDVAHARLTPSTVLAVIPRMNSSPSFHDAVMAAMARHAPVSVRILSMQPDSVREQEVCRRFVVEIGARASVQPVRRLQELTGALQDCGHLVTERYHGALAGLALGIPLTIVPQQEGDKLSALRGINDPVAMDQMRERLRTGEEELQKFMNMLK